MSSSAPLACANSTSASAVESTSAFDSISVAISPSDAAPHSPSEHNSNRSRALGTSTSGATPDARLYISRSWLAAQPFRREPGALRELSDRHDVFHAGQHELSPTVKAKQVRSQGL